MSASNKKGTVGERLGKDEKSGQSWWRDQACPEGLRNLIIQTESKLEIEHVGGCHIFAIQTLIKHHFFNPKVPPPRPELLHELVIAGNERKTSLAQIAGKLGLATQGGNDFVHQFLIIKLGMQVLREREKIQSNHFGFMFGPVSGDVRVSDAKNLSKQTPKRGLPSDRELLDADINNLSILTQLHPFCHTMWVSGTSEYYISFNFSSYGTNKQAQGSGD
ncbi:hypothetical protein DFH09DRAFT_1083645 [Mycena vulgaris]|nr:hypothetical protein DFH09DRAFT_1083645 [Mycena vulgaris]